VVMELMLPTSPTIPKQMTSAMSTSAMDLLHKLGHLNLELMLYFNPLRTVH